MTEAKQEPAPKKAKGPLTFSLNLDNSKILRGIIETLSSIIDETEFRINPEEFTISAMDPSRICLLKLTIPNHGFDEYECTGEGRIGLNLDDMDKILRRSSNRDALTIEYSEDGAQKIKIKMKREETSRTRTFSLALIDIDIEEVPMDNLLEIEYPSKWFMDPDFLTEAIKDAEIYAEILNVKADGGEGLTFSASGQIGEMEYSLAIDDLIESDLDEDTQKGAYSLTFLKAILKIASITEKLEISLRTDHPLKMIFSLLEGGELSYFLAPRVEEADFDEDDLEDDF